jgi:hypothetical protein
VADAGSAIRSLERSRLLRRRSIVAASVVVAVIALGIAIGIEVSKLWMFVAVPAIGMLAWTIGGLQSADETSAESFYDTYAKQRGLSLTGEHSLPAATPSLREGRRREAPQVLRGELGEGAQGTVALYRYFTPGESGDTGSAWAVVLLEVPECAELVPELGCYRKKGPGVFGVPSNPSFWRSRERINLESTALAQHYMVLGAKGQDQNGIRQLFSPTFIEWLATSLPGKFQFELEHGVLCCLHEGYPKDFTDLDALRDAALGIAKRLREEAAESSRPQ